MRLRGEGLLPPLLSGVPASAFSDNHHTFCVWQHSSCQGQIRRDRDKAALAPGRAVKAEPTPPPGDPGNGQELGPPGNHGSWREWAWCVLGERCAHTRAHAHTCTHAHVCPCGRCSELPQFISWLYLSRHRPHLLFILSADQVSSASSHALEARGPGIFWVM